MKKSQTKIITLDVRQNTIKRAIRLSKDAPNNTKTCPLALAGKKIFRKKNQSPYVNYVGSLVIDYYENGALVKTEYYDPLSRDAAIQLVRTFDAGNYKALKPKKLRYKLGQDFSHKTFN